MKHSSLETVPKEDSVLYSAACLASVITQHNVAKRVWTVFRAPLSWTMVAVRDFSEEDGILWAPRGPLPAPVRYSSTSSDLVSGPQWVLLEKAAKPRPLEAGRGFCDQLCPELFSQWLPRNHVLSLRKNRQDQLSCRTVCNGLISVKDSAPFSLNSHRKWYLKTTWAGSMLRPLWSRS